MGRVAGENREVAEGQIHRHTRIREHYAETGFFWTELVDTTLTNFHPVLVKIPVSLILFGVN